MEQPLNEQTPVFAIVGGAGGIGSATARILRERGARLMLGGRSEESLKLLADELDAESMAFDARDFEATQAFMERAAGIEGRFSGVVNCAGSLLLKPAHLTSRAEFDATLGANLTTAFATVRAAVRHLRDQGGSIVLVSSAAATVGLAQHEAIAAAKAGVEGLTRSAATTYAPQQIRVNAVAPGLVRTPLTERITSSPAGLKASLSMHPLGRVGEPEDVARLIAWLLGPESSWITGEVWNVDGGLGRLKGRSAS